MNWSVKTMSPGMYSSRSEPTVDGASMRLTPSCFSAWMFARAGMSVGRMACFLPCLGRNATFLPFNSPMVMASEGFPYGVSRLTSFVIVKSFGSLRPVPPIIPISACMQSNCWRLAYKNNA